MKKSLIFLPLLILSCSKQQTIKKINWEGSEEPPQVHAQNVQSTVSLKSNSDEISIERQFIDGVEVEQSYIKNISYIKNKKRFINAAYFEEIPSKLSKNLVKLKEYSSQHWIDLVYKQDPQLKNRTLLDQPQLKIILHNEQLIPVIRFNFLINFEEVESLVFDQNLNLLKTEKVSSHFAQTKALVYPEGPKITPLTTVLIKTSGDTESTVTAPQISISSESNQKINLNDSLIFTPPDEKFDQVQVYYYVNKALSWFEEKLHVNKDYLTLKVITHLGYPEKTNAAFFYNNTIRLGAGDDVAFSQISLDPSIVMHEAGHALVGVLASLPYQGEGGSLNEGFADFLTCYQLKNPKLGEVAYKKAPYKREISTLVPMKDKNGGLYHDSAIVSSLFWKMKEKIGDEKSLNLAVDTLKRLNPVSTLSDFQTEVAKVIETNLQGQDLKNAQEIYKNWSDL